MLARPLILAAAMTGAAPTASLAQEMYFGGGLAYTSGTSKSSDGDQSDLRAGMASLVFGQRFARGNGFWGWETSADLSFGAETEEVTFGAACTSVALGPYLCDHVATVRFMGIAGTPISDSMQVFGGLGVGVVVGDFATSLATTGRGSVAGLSATLGVEASLGNGSSLRGEVLYDNFTNANQSGGYDSDYTGATFRLMLLKQL